MYFGTNIAFYLKMTKKTGNEQPEYTLIHMSQTLPIVSLFGSTN